MKVFNTAAAISVIAGSAFAEGHISGDAASGETLFARQCVACHVVADSDGEVLAGRNANVGPNLYGIAGRTPGSVEGFRYGDAIIAAGEGGAVFDEATFVGYTMDPTGWLRDVTGDARARSKMAFRVRSDAEAADIYAYLASFEDAEDDDDMDDDATTE